MDLTKIDKPFGLLDEETKKALRKHPGPIEVFSTDGWKRIEWPGWTGFARAITYRAVDTRHLKVKDWSLIDPRIKYVARDKSGKVHGFQEMPDCGYDGHWSYDAGSDYPLDAVAGPDLLIDPGTCDWTEALAKRPEEE